MIVTEEKKMYLFYFSTNRNIRKLVRYIFVILEVLWKEESNLIISSDVVVSASFFYLEKTILTILK